MESLYFELEEFFYYNCVSPAFWYKRVEMNLSSKEYLIIACQLMSIVAVFPFYHVTVM